MRYVTSSNSYSLHVQEKMALESIRKILPFAKGKTNMGIEKKKKVCVCIYE